MNSLQAMEIITVGSSCNLSILNIYNHTKSFRQKMGLYNPKKERRDVNLFDRFNAL